MPTPSPFPPVDDRGRRRTSWWVLLVVALGVVVVGLLAFGDRLEATIDRGAEDAAAQAPADADRREPERPGDLGTTPAAPRELPRSPARVPGAR